MNAPLDAIDEAWVSELAARKPSELTPALLELMRRQAARKRPAQVMAQFKRDAFVKPSALDLRLAHALDGLALAAASDYEAVLLSPLAPLGCCAAVSPSHQHRIVSTVRGSEVASDPTNVFALECAQRLAVAPQAHVRLCTVHQVVRAQAFAKDAGRSQHFRMFALAAAGKARADYAFELDAIAGQLGVFWRLCESFTTLGYPIPTLDLKLLVANDAAAIGDRLAQRLSDAFPNAPLQREVFDHAYYGAIRVLFGVTAPSGRHEFIADAGMFDWVARLTSNQSMRFVASGFGLQLVPHLFA
jgi:hypothetical protein